MRITNYLDEMEMDFFKNCSWLLELFPRCFYPLGLNRYQSRKRVFLEEIKIQSARSVKIT